MRIQVPYGYPFPSSLFHCGFFSRSLCFDWLISLVGNWLLVVIWHPIQQKILPDGRVWHQVLGWGRWWLKGDGLWPRGPLGPVPAFSSRWGGGLCWIGLGVYKRSLNVSTYIVGVRPSGRTMLALSMKGQNHSNRGSQAPQALFCTDRAALILGPSCPRSGTRPMGHKHAARAPG